MSEREIVESDLLDMVPMPSGRLEAHVNPTRRKQRLTPAVRAARMAQYADLFFKRKSQAEICVEMGLSRGAVITVQRELEALWLERAGASFDKARARELVEIDRLQKVYEDAYEASKLKHQRQRKDSDYVDAPMPRGREASARATIERVRRDRAHAVQVTEKPEGDSKFLDGIMRCIDRRIKLLGLDEPEKFNIGIGVENKQHGRTAIEERYSKAFALFGVSLESHAGPAAQGRDALFDGDGESLDSGDAYIETSGVLNPR